MTNKLLNTIFYFILFISDLKFPDFPRLAFFLFRWTVLVIAPLHISSSALFSPPEYLVPPACPLSPFPPLLLFSPPENLPLPLFPLSPFSHSPPFLPSRVPSSSFSPLFSPHHCLLIPPCRRKTPLPCPRISGDFTVFTG